MMSRFSPSSAELQNFCMGPLAPHLAGVAALLTQQGYSTYSGSTKIHLVAALSLWLDRHKIELIHLNEKVISSFFRSRGRRIAMRDGDEHLMNLLLSYLRQLDVIPPQEATACSAIDLVAKDFECFLLQERGLRPATAKQHQVIARRFLSHRFGTGKVALKKLHTGDVSRFVLHDTPNYSRSSAQQITSVLRSFFGFLLRDGKIDANLAAAVPTVAHWRLSELPRFLEPEQVEKVLACCDRTTKVGIRDYAILLLLARLGLRAGEVVSLVLEDLDWIAGELCIHGKGDRLDRLPLPKDVGQAIVDYLKKARPACSSRRVFIQTAAPYVGFFASGAVSSLVRKALERAQIDSPHKGAHLFRHSLATTMLGHGASLRQIGHVLRHQLTQSTEIYAKVNLKALRALAPVWPGGKP